MPVRLEMSGGEVSDFKGFGVLVDDDLPKAKVFLAVRGYDSDHIRDTIIERGGTPITPARPIERFPSKPAP